MRVQFGIRIDGRIETFHVLVAELIRYRQHAGFDVLHLLQPDLVDLFG
jgi:hypothetical protein